MNKNVQNERSIHHKASKEQDLVDAFINLIKHTSEPSLSDILLTLKSDERESDTSNNSSLAATSAAKLIITTI